MKFFKKSTYHQSLIIVLSLLLIVFCIPYAVTLYSSSRSRILDTMQTANNQNLQQIKYNYDIYEDIISNLCFSIYLDNETQSLLYNPQVTYQEAYRQIDYFKSSVLNVYPFVYSITVYNGIQQKYYSTLMDSTEYLATLPELFTDNKMPVRLQPILRRIPNENGSGEFYVYSYLIYDFENSETNSASYIVIEQNANWLIDNFTQIQRTAGDIPTELYLLDKDGNIFSQDPSTIPQDSLNVLEDYFSTGGKQPADSKQDESLYTDDYSFHGGHYLITQLFLNSSGDSLLMLQNYNDVFSNLQSFRHTFTFFIIIWVLLFAAAIWGVSKKLYAPVHKMLKFVNGLSGHTPETGNEFQQLMNLYKDSYDKLTNHTNAAHYVMTHYQLEKLLTDSSETVWKNFAAYTPDHWLASASGIPLRVFHITIDNRKSDGDLWSEDDIRLFLFAAQNILAELLEKERPAEVFISNEYSVWGIMKSNGCSRDKALEDILLQTQTYLKDYLYIRLNATYSSEALHPEDLSGLYHEVLSLHDYHYIFGPDAIISPDTCRENLENECDHIPDNLVKKCLSAIKRNSFDSASDTIDQIFHTFRTMRHENVKICIMTLANQINFTLKELCTSKGILTRIRYEQVYSLFDSAQYMCEAQNGLKDYLKNTLCIFQTKKDEDKEHLFIQSIQDYITANYSDPNLSSQLIGEQFHLSAKYVMKRFVNYSGISLNDYIIEVRMHQAAVLLKNSDLSIGKVAASVGILNENYFYKLFKKFYGCTPREYSVKSGT